MSSLINRILNNKHFKNGAPFFLFIFGGAYALKEFRSVRYDPELNPKATKFVKPEEVFNDLETKSGKKVQFAKTKNSLEEDLDIYDQKVDTENWEQKRGPSVMNRYFRPSRLSTPRTRT